MYVSAWAIAVALHLSLARAVATREPSTCEALEADLPGRVAYPGTLDYTTSNHYWSARQSGLSPPCFVRPTTALEVSEALKLLTASRSPFTVKAGGHTAFGTGSSIRDGVTIDLAAMNSIIVSPDRSTVSIGPGARWLNVSQALDPLGLAVVGGRSPDVGVSGLILGGGISFLSGRRGWACDNVQNFEIVLASGEIVNANARQHSDLYRALRGGGGSSFGVVTRFDLDAYEQGDVWGGLTIWPESEASDVIGTFLGISRDVLHTDEDVHLFIVLGYLLGTNDPVVAAFAWHLNHLEPPNGSFDTFEGLARLPGQMSNQTWVAPISDQIKTLWEPYGNRKTWWDTTVSDGAGSNILFDEIIALWKTYAKEIRAAGEERGTVVNPGLAIQPITSTTREAMKRNGGNALGLEPGEAPLFLVHAPVSWTDRSLDCLIEERTKRFIAAVDQLADEKGFGNGFKYMNYAGKTEDVFASYGAENKQRLLSVAQKYDPDGLLRDLWEGYFKVY